MKLLNRIEEGLLPEGHVDIEEYHGFLKSMPVICVEVIIKAKDKVLLIKRNDEPCKGQWCFPGGRLYKNESLLAAVKRIVRVEVGIKIDWAVLLSVNEITFPKGQNGGQIHNIIFTYIVCVPESIEIAIDNTSSEYKLATMEQKNMAAHVKAILKEYVYDKTC